MMGFSVSRTDFRDFCVGVAIPLFVMSDMSSITAGVREVSVRKKYVVTTQRVSNFKLLTLIEEETSSF